MKTVYLDNFSTKSKNDILLCIFGCLLIKLSFEFMKSCDIYKMRYNISAICLIRNIVYYIDST